MRRSKNSQKQDRAGVNRPCGATGDWKPCSQRATAPVMPSVICDPESRCTLRLDAVSTPEAVPPALPSSIRPGIAVACVPRERVVPAACVPSLPTEVSCRGRLVHLCAVCAETGVWALASADACANRGMLETDTNRAANRIAIFIVFPSRFHCKIGSVPGSLHSAEGRFHRMAEGRHAHVQTAATQVTAAI